MKIRTWKGPACVSCSTPARLCGSDLMRPRAVPQWGLLAIVQLPKATFQLRDRGVADILVLLQDSDFRISFPFQPAEVLLVAGQQEVVDCDRIDTTVVDCLSVMHRLAGVVSHARRLEVAALPPVGNSLRKNPLEICPGDLDRYDLAAERKDADNVVFGHFARLDHVIDAD